MLFISTLRIIPITIHSLGLVCLYKQKQRKHIQKTLLMNLSFIEILLVTAGFFVSVVEVFQWISNVIYNRIVVSVYVISNLMFYIIMFIITIDRLLCVVLHVRYSYYITPLRVKKFLLGTWACAFVGFLTLCIADVSKIYRYAIYLYLTLDILFVIIAIVTYILVTMTIKFSKRNHSSTQERNKRKYLVPMVLVLTFIIFYCIPDFVIAIFVHSNFVRYIVMLFWSIGVIADPLTYIFLDRRNRTEMKRFFNFSSMKSRPDKHKVTIRTISL